MDLPIAAHQLLVRLQTTNRGRWLLARFSGDVQQLGGFSFAMTRIGGIVLSSATALTGLVIVGVASLYFAAEPDLYLKGLRLVIPLPYRSTFDRCLASATRMLRSWLLAKAVSMTAVGLLISIGLWILDIPLGGNTRYHRCLFDIYSQRRPILSAVPAGLLAFAISPTKGLLTVLLFCVVHFVEGNLVTSLAERRS